MTIPDTALTEINFKELIQKYIDFRKTVWSDAVNKRPWWKIWQNIQIVSMTKFLIESLDQLIPYFSQFQDMNGLAKKAFVMEAIGQLYDFIAPQCLPVWLKAFSPMIKDIVLNHIISPSIDWIVSQYKNNQWVNVGAELNGKTVIKDLF